MCVCVCVQIYHISFCEYKVMSRIHTILLFANSETGSGREEIIKHVFKQVLIIQIFAQNALLMLVFFKVINEGTLKVN